MTQKSTRSLSPCGQIAYQHDSDRFLAALFAPAQIREKIFTLLAFNYELAVIRESVSNPLLGRIRLQWWREGVEALAQGHPPARHEVMESLASLLSSGQVTASALIAMIDSREVDFEEEAVITPTYARATAAPLLRAMGEEADDIATGYALVGLMRAGRCEVDPAVVADILKSKPPRGTQARLWRALARSYLRRGCPSGPLPWRALTLLCSLW